MKRPSFFSTRPPIPVLEPHQAISVAERDRRIEARLEDGEEADDKSDGYGDAQSPNEREPRESHQHPDCKLEIEPGADRRRDSTRGSPCQRTPVRRQRVHPRATSIDQE